MGEAAPTQATAAGFSPMIGVGMVGSVPAGVTGSISSSRSSAVPELHSAIVERLRARIELCRRHHSTCESRYQRGQAESSDREREATLQLLNIVHQGTGTRKTKGRSGSQQPLEYSRANGEQKSHNVSEADSKLSTRIALQGSLRRKIEGQPPGYNPKQNGLSCTGLPPDFKRLRMETNSLRPAPCAMDPGHPQSLAGSAGIGHALRRKEPFMMPHGVGNDIFNMTLREMKKEPTDVQTCSQSSADPAMMVFDFKDEAGGHIDPELQDLFDELTKSVPPFSEQDLEKMLKQDDDFGLDLGRSNSTGATHACPHLDRPIKTEYSPDFCLAPASSPQLRPASAGPSFSMANSLSTSLVGPGQINHSHVSQTAGTSSRGLPSWPEMSHAEQLKQMAANQQPKQQPSSHLHHPQHLNQGGGIRTWPSAMGGLPSTSSFDQEAISSSGSLNHARISPQNAGQDKGMANYLFKPSGYNPCNPTDMKLLSSKPMLHFTPKAASSTTGQQIPHMTGTHSKAATQQQANGASNMQFPLPMQSSSSCLQPKPLSQRPSLNQHGPGMNFKMTQQRQAMAPVPRLSANGCLVDLGQPQQQQRSAASNHQQKNAAKGQRQLSQAQHLNSDAEKFNTQDQFNRHLTRPPPDYKQPQSAAGVQHPNLYPGLTSSPMTNKSSDQTDISSLSCHTPNSQGAKMVTSSADRCFHARSDPHSGSLEIPNCGNQLHQQPNGQVQIGMLPNKTQFQGAKTQAVNFQPGIVPSTQLLRTSAGQDAALGQGLGGITTTTGRDTIPSWGAGAKQSGTLQGLDMKRLPGTVPTQGPQTDGHFGSRPVGPPNQVAPHSGLVPQTSRAGQPRIPPLPGVSGLNHPSPEQHGSMGTFVGTASSPGSYQNSRAGRLTFDFLQDGDNTVPAINADSDFIDSLLKSGSGNDDWMKDINLEEILGGHS